MKDRQISMDDKLFEKEKEQLKLLDGLSKLASNTAHVTHIAGASAGNYAPNTEFHKVLAEVGSYLGTMNYWIALLRRQSAKGAVGYQVQSLDHYLKVARQPYGYVEEQVKTPYGVYESYVRLITNINNTIRANQRAIDEVNGGNRLIGEILDDVQSIGEELEAII
jgi:hypothetical protein